MSVSSDLRQASYALEKGQFKVIKNVEVDHFLCRLFSFWNSGEMIHVLFYFRYQFLMSGAFVRQCPGCVCLF